MLVASQTIDPSRERGDDGEQVFDQFFVGGAGGGLVERVDMDPVAAKVGAEVGESESGQSIGVGYYNPIHLLGLNEPEEARQTWSARI